MPRTTKEGELFLKLGLCSDVVMSVHEDDAFVTKGLGLLAINEATAVSRTTFEGRRRALLLLFLRRNGMRGKKGLGESDQSLVDLRSDSDGGSDQGLEEGGELLTNGGDLRYGRLSRCLFFQDESQKRTRRRGGESNGLFQFGVRADRAQVSLIVDVAHDCFVPLGRCACFEHIAQ